MSLTNSTLTIKSTLFYQVTFISHTSKCLTVHLRMSSGRYPLDGITIFRPRAVHLGDWKFELPKKANPEPELFMA